MAIYADESIVHATALTRIFDTMVFSNLRHLELCIGDLRCVSADPEGSLTCLNYARNLASFNLW
jgi:hypothetical protein